MEVQVQKRERRSELMLENSLGLLALPGEHAKGSSRRRRSAEREGQANKFGTLVAFALAGKRMYLGTVAYLPAF